MRKSSEIVADITDLRAEVQAIIDVAESEKRELLDDEQSRVDEILNENGLIAKAEANLERTLKIEASKKQAIRAGLAGKLDQQLVDTGNITLKVPARARALSVPRGFANMDDAYAAGQYVMAHVCGNAHSRQWCQDHGIQAAMTTGNNPKGGYLVPDPMESAVIEQVLQYGVARNETMVVPMSDGSNKWPKLNSDLSAYYIGEGVAITQSEIGLEQVRLEARKIGTLTAVSSELNEDSVVALTELLTRSIARQIAKAEDQALFLGDGTSTYGGIVGLGSALAAGSIVDAASGNVSFATLDLDDFENVQAELSEYATNPKWYISKKGFHKSMARLANAQGGNTKDDTAQGASKVQFLGDPVVFVNVMPRTDAVSTIQVYYGDLMDGVMFGDRRGISIVADESFLFSQDLVAIRGTRRYDLNVHDRGTSTVGGGIIALKTAAS